MANALENVRMYKKKRGVVGTLAISVHRCYWKFISSVYTCGKTFSQPDCRHREHEPHCFLLANLLVCMWPWALESIACLFPALRVCLYTHFKCSVYNFFFFYCGRYLHCSKNLLLVLCSQVMQSYVTALLYGFIRLCVATENNEVPSWNSCLFPIASRLF